MTSKNINYQGPNANQFFEAINHNCDKGWQIVPGTMYITSIETYVDGVTTIPYDMRTRKLEIIAFVAMEK